MNLNEVKKHVKFDMFLTFLIYFMIAVCLFIALIFTLAIPAKAASNNINSYSHSTCGSSMGSGSYYGSFQNGTCYSRAIGTTYSGKTSLVGFWLNYNFQAGKYYTFTINFKDNDLISSTIVDVVRVYNVSNSTEWSSTYNFISKKQFKVYFLAPTNSSSLAISLSSGSGDPITGVSNYGISSVYLEDNDNSDEIINANNQNTQNIISNNNANASDTQNVIINTAGSIINELANRCNNILDMSLFTPGVLINNEGSWYNPGGSISSIDKSNGSLSFTTDSAWKGVFYNQYLDVSDYDLYLNFNTDNSLLIKVSSYDINYNFLEQNMIYTSGSYSSKLCSSSNVSVCNSVNTKYIRFSIETSVFSNFTISNTRLNSNNGPFCVFGSTISKLDIVENFLDLLHGDNEAIQDAAEQIKDLQQDSYDYLTDDTNPTVPNNEINDVLGLVNVNNPLGYLISLPLTLVQKLNIALNTECQDYEIGRFGFTGWNETLKFPCIHPERHLGSALWNTIDIIVGIGLLALTIYKVYQAVSNILTLGGEDTASGSFVYWSPMEFLAIICGGTSVGVYQRRSKE